MGRAPRTDVGGYVYHALNRANARMPIFKRDSDYRLFERTLTEAKDRASMRILAYCVMPNHWHLVLHPQKDGDLSSFMSWLTLTHTQRWHAGQRTVGQGHLYQGRYKSFLCEADEHFILLARYVEQNPLRAGLARRSQDWRWSSAWRRSYGTIQQRKLLDKWPVPMPHEYEKLENDAQPAIEVETLRHSVEKGNPYGSDLWVRHTVKAFDLVSTVRTRGRPRKGS